MLAFSKLIQLELDDDLNRIKSINQRVKQTKNKIVLFNSKDSKTNQSKIQLGDGTIQYSRYLSNAAVSPGNRIPGYIEPITLSKPA